MLQDLFDELDTLERTVTGEVAVYYERWMPMADPVAVGLPRGSMVVYLRFVWPGALIQLRTHNYVTPSGEIAMSGLLDPKSMRYAGEKILRTLH